MGLALLGLDLEKLRAQVAAVGYSWVTAPFEKYQLSNLGGRITATRKRIEAVRARQDRAADAERKGGIGIEYLGRYVRVTFAEKPARSVLEALRAAGFHWSSGCWGGELERLPEIVKELDRAPSNEKARLDGSPSGPRSSRDRV